MLEKPTLENPTQLNTKRKNKEKQNTDQSITDSIPFPSGFPETSTQKRTETKESFESYRELILENIDYDILASDPHVDREQLDEIAQLVQETVCSTRDRTAPSFVLTVWGKYRLLFFLVLCYDIRGN